ncbi:FAD-dependent oxidoreductase [Amycolatopsis samaneae]|uniref:FAD-dependent oxidoreductase n=1 Tax=Amycolatopsis samaneae TaxID=664691 RepID=A0ABW5GLI6_9PSEU
MGDRVRSRRAFLRGSSTAAVGVAATLAGTKAGYAGQVPKNRVAVLGGGVAGLTVAHELAERGFAVTVYERNALGGKARSIAVPGTGTHGRPDLPGEHGFRFFPGFYHNLPDTMRRIPFSGNRNGTWDNLTSASAVLMSRMGGRADLTIPFPVPLPANPPPLTPESFLESVVSLFQTMFRLPAHEIAFAAQKTLVFVTSCEERRVGQWDDVTWADYTRTAWFSDEYDKLLADGLVRNLVASKSKEASTYAIGVVAEAVLWSLLGFGNEPGSSVDRVLCGSTSEMWLDPWIEHLRAEGVEFRVGWAAEAFELAEGRIAAASVVNGAGERRRVDADWFVSAMPVERAAKLLSPSLLAADPALAGIRELGTDWMVGLQFFLNREVPITPGHVNYEDSGWAITSISQQQFWKRRFDAYGDGTVRDCLSAILSDWSSPGNFTAKSARQCTPARLAAETWAVMKAHLNDTGETVLDDGMLHSWFLDPAITGSGTSDVDNETPLFIQKPGTWKARPAAKTAVPNLFFAGDWLRTSINITTMEGANEAARQAVNGVLDAAGSAEPRCRVAGLWANPAFDALKAADLGLYRSGLPNAFDLLDPRRP